MAAHDPPAAPGGGLTPQQPITMREVQEKIDQLYGSRDAKNVGQGLLKGAVSVGKGIFAGVGGLIAAPVVGAAKEGGVGFLKGAAVGIAGAVVLPTIGLVHGVRQVGEGIRNTPEAVKRMMEKDKSEQAAEKAEVVDDPNIHQVNEKTYSMSREKVEDFAFDKTHPVAAAAAAAAATSTAAAPDAEPAGDAGASSAATTATDAAAASEAPAAAAASAPAGSIYQGVAAPKETGFYEVLGVASTSSSAEIKKGYYKLAVKLHPDKNPGDENANEKFAELGEAYQVLIDPEKREQYDKYGKDGLAEGATMDPKEFFNMAFGAEAFRPLIGELTVAHTAGQEVSAEQFRVWQREREHLLAEGLLERLRPWLEGKEEEFVKESLALVEKLKHEDFAAPMLQCIGYTYYHKAEVCLGLQSMLGVPGYLNAIKLHGHTLKSQYKAVDAAVKLQDLKIKAESGQPPVGAFPDFLNAIWLISALDIESTLRHVVEIVVMDKSIMKDERRTRARGIMKFGKILLES